MAYNDYGGYAYKNGKRVVERSDFTITPDGGFESPGMWPGFGAIMQGKSKEEVAKICEYPNGHAVLGDGPIFVVLYKQSSLTVYRGLELVENTPQNDWNADADQAASFMVDACRIDVHWREEDNFYQYVRLEQPDKNVWHGWSGYGVGAGLEDSPDHPFSTPDREATLKSIWPEDF